MRWRRATNDEVLVASIWVIGAVAAAAARPFAPLVAAQLPGCTLHALTGVPCPTCGATRAALALARGDWMAAALANPLIAAALTGFFAGAALVPLWLVAGAPLAAATPFSLRTFRWVAIGVVAANWLFVLARELRG